VKSDNLHHFKIVKWGNSHAFRIPAKFARDKGIKAGDFVWLDVAAIAKFLAERREQNNP
jgi:antitoxin component of MazEF toxin-antitoxin module